MKRNFDWNYVSAGAPYITISSTAIAVNSPAISLLGNPENVAVGFDEKNMMIGIIPHDGSNEVKSYKFLSRMKNGWVRVGCKDFIKYLTALTGKKFSPAVRYVAKHNSEENLLYISVLESEVENEVNEDDN